MELRYPILFIILAIVVAVVSTVLFLRKDKIGYFMNNLSFIKKLPTFHSQQRKFKILRFTSNFLFFLIIADLLLLVARPTQTLTFKDDKKGIDIIVTLDVSPSMYLSINKFYDTERIYSIETADYAPIDETRVEAARKQIDGFISKEKNDRIGIIYYSGQALTICPLTYDYGIAKEFLKDVRDRNLIFSTFPGGGTASGDAMLLASQKFPKDIKREKVIILLTDGETNRGVDTVEAAKTIKSSGVRVYPIIFGPEVDTFSYEDLKQVAKTTNGKFYKASGEENLNTVLNEIAKLEKRDIKTTSKVVKIDNPQIYMISLIPLILFYLITSVLIRKWI